jgi:hypothetical protein
MAVTNETEGTETLCCIPHNMYETFTFTRHDKTGKENDSRVLEEVRICTH